MMVTTLSLNYLLQIQSPDFHPGRPPPPPPKPKPRPERGMSQSNPPSSLKAPHLKQLERLAKLWAPQFPAAQYQSPGRTSEPVLLKPREDPPLPPPKLPKSPLSTPDFGSPHRWHESLLWKFKWWHDLQFQSPGRLIFLFYSAQRKKKKLTYLYVHRQYMYKYVSHLFPHVTI